MPALDASLRVEPLLLTRLAAMMFLQYGSLGLWVVTIGTYFDRNTGSAGSGMFSAGFVGLSATTAALGAIISPLLLGIVADRYVATQKLLALLHACCAACLWFMPHCRTELGFYLAMLLYFQAYSPTVTLSTSLSLRALDGAPELFPVVRAIGTLGWMAAGVAVGFLWPRVTGQSIEGAITPVYLAFGAHLLLAAYCFSLPHTPALGRALGGWRAVAGGQALWSNRPFLVFLGVSMLAAASTQFYDRFSNVFLNQVGVEHAAAKLTLGQLMEVGCMMAMPFLVLRFRVRTLFLCGVAAWAVRFGLLAASGDGHPWSIYPAILVHGFCYTLVYMLGQLYADRLADNERRGAAQGLHSLATGGFGHLVGALAASWAQATYLTPPGVEPTYRWGLFWGFALALSLAATLLFAWLFSDSSKLDPQGPADATEKS